MYKIVLSVDGGGIRGIVSCRILLRLLDEIRKISRKDNIQLSQCIDYFAGTSTGSVVVSALLTPSVYNPSIPAFTLRDIQSFYLENANKIFSKELLHRVISFGGLIKSKYQNKGFKDILYSYFGNLHLSNLLKPCTIPSFDLYQNSNLLFNQQHAAEDNSKNFYVRDVCLASSSAPIIFPSVQITSFSGDSYLCCDGAVYANNPSLFAYADFREMDNDAYANNMLFISIGNGLSNSRHDYSGFEHSGGASNWVDKIGNVFIDSVSNSIDHQMKMIYRECPNLYCRWVPTIPEWANTDIDITNIEDISKMMDCADAFIDLNQKEIRKVAMLLYNKYEEEHPESEALATNIVTSKKSIQPMDNIWSYRYTGIARYPINFSEFNNLTDLFNHSIRNYGTRIAYESFDHTLNYNQIGHYSDKIAGWLQKHAELKPGERVAIFLPNVLAFPPIIIGIIKAGLIPVCCNPTYTSTELEFVIKDSGAKLIFAFDRNAKVVQDALTSNPIPVIQVSITSLFPKKRAIVLNLGLTFKLGIKDSWSIPTLKLHEILKQTDSTVPRQTDCNPDDPALFQYTGGTTGKMKAAVLTHKNLIANILQITAIFPDSFTRPESQQIAYTPLPLYHIFSMTVNLLTMFYLGNHNVLIVNPRNLSLVMSSLSKYRYNLITGVSTLYAAIVNHKDIKDIDFSEMQVCIAGGMAVPNFIGKKWQEVTNSIIIQGYGLTEASPVVSCSPHDVTNFDGSVGIPLPGTSIAIVDEHLKPTAKGDVGQLLVKGPQVMKEYLNQPEETNNSIIDKEWLQTGDLARIDERGFIFIADRLKNMINVSGFKIYPNEVEDVLTKHQAISEAAVIGIASEATGQKIVAFIIKEKSMEVNEKMLREHCHEYLTNYKVPKQFIFTKELPKTTVGKILHRKLKEQYFPND